MSDNTFDGSRFAGRVAVVTGAASGIGAAVAKRLVGEGASVVGIDLAADALTVLEKDLGERFAGVTADVTVEEEVAAAVAVATERFGSLDLAFNVAGAARGGKILDLAESDWDFTVDLVQKGSSCAPSTRRGTWWTVRGAGRSSTSRRSTRTSRWWAAART